MYRYFANVFINFTIFYLSLSLENSSPAILFHPVSFYCTDLAAPPFLPGFWVWDGEGSSGSSFGRLRIPWVTRLLWSCCSYAFVLFCFLHPSFQHLPVSWTCKACPCWSKHVARQAKESVSRPAAYIASPEITLKQRELKWANEANDKGYTARAQPPIGPVSCAGTSQRSQTSQKQSKQIDPEIGSDIQINKQADNRPKHSGKRLKDTFLYVWLNHVFDTFRNTKIVEKAGCWYPISVLDTMSPINHLILAELAKELLTASFFKASADEGRSFGSLVAGGRKSVTANKHQ